VSTHALPLYDRVWKGINDMAAIQVVLDSELLKAVDKLVSRTKQNRSALIRRALREYLQKLENQEKEERE